MTPSHTTTTTTARSGHNGYDGEREHEHERGGHHDYHPHREPPRHNAWTNFLGSVLSSTTGNASFPSRPSHHHRRRTSGSMRSIHKPRKPWPPSPVVEDERDALKKEVNPLATAPPANLDVPSRGEVDQQPILLEVETWRETTTRLRANSRESQRSSRMKKNQEWRFIHIPKHEDQFADEQQRVQRTEVSDRSWGEMLTYRFQPRPPLTPKTPNTDRQSLHVPTEDHQNELSRKKKDIRERAPSRGRLPPKIDTDLHDDPPVFTRREPSPYAYSKPVQSKEGNVLRPTSGEYFLSPDTITPSSPFIPKDRGRDSGYSSAGTTLRNEVKEDSSDPSSDDWNYHHRRRKSSRRSSSRYDDRETISRYKDDRRHEGRSSGESDRHESRHSSRPSSRYHERPRTPEPRTPERSHERPAPILRSLTTPYSPTQARNIPQQNKYTSKPNSPMYTFPHSPPSPPSDFFKHADHSVPNLSKSSVPRSRPLSRDGSVSGASDSARSVSFDLSNMYPRSRRGSRDDSRPSSPVSSYHSTHHQYPPQGRSPLVIDMFDNMHGKSNLVPHKASRPTTPLPIIDDEELIHTRIPRTDLIETPTNYLRASTLNAAKANRELQYTPTTPKIPPSPKYMSKSPTASYFDIKPAAPRPAEDYKLAPLPRCPQHRLVYAYDSYYSLADSSSFDVCASCFHSIISSTPHVTSFVRSHPRAPGTETRCAFSFPWVRVAWILTLKHRKPDLNLLYDISDIAITEPPCPGSTPALRSWHSLIDPSTASPVPNFDICPSCVKSLEALLPSLRGIFISPSLATSLSKPKPPGSPHAILSERTCDLRFDSHRFLLYVDALEVMADRASRTHAPPDVRGFAAYARRRAALRECPGPDTVAGRTWHLLPGVPELAICEECYHDVVVPSTAPSTASDGALAMRVGRHPVFLSNSIDDDEVSCGLWSKRMRDVWREACARGERDGEMFLRRIVRERQERLAEVGRERKKLLLAAQRGLGRDVADGLERVEAERKRWE